MTVMAAPAASLSVMPGRSASVSAGAGVGAAARIAAPSASPCRAGATCKRGRAGAARAGRGSGRVSRCTSRARPTGACAAVSGTSAASVNAVRVAGDAGKGDAVSGAGKGASASRAQTPLAASSAMTPRGRASLFPMPSDARLPFLSLMPVLSVCPDRTAIACRALPDNECPCHRLGDTRCAADAAQAYRHDRARAMGVSTGPRIRSSKGCLTRVGASPLAPAG